MATSITKLSRFLSYVLRHNPGSIGLVLDGHGWASVNDLIRLANKKGIQINRALLERTVAENDKKRFSFSDDEQRMRANQGHSVAVDLGLPTSIPPKLLYHGTSVHLIESIFATGLRPGNRQHVHLSNNIATAIKVGQRHGKTVSVLEIRAYEMYLENYKFFLSVNDIWLTKHVPKDFINLKY
ncbi:MAG: RNA 2'-phosphotransferase [Magnetococcales bacterium]|nr:RNA 2'-phosphotransferase [Magnetococcales bacterium]